MKKLKIIADDKIPFLKGAFENVASIRYYPGREINNTIVRDTDVLLIRTRTKCNETLLKGSAVKFIASATIGHDHIDSEYCENHGIVWTNAPGCNASSVEQYVTSAILELASRYNFRPEEKTIGIVGVGNVGSKVARAVKALGMNVLLNDPPREKIEGPAEFTPISDLKKESDIISFHVPLNKEGEYQTKNMLDKNFLASLKDDAIVINTSRGEIMDEDALKWSLESGKIGKAVLDVWQKEPEIDRDLLNLTAIATPHIAGYSTDGKAKGTEMSIHAISTFFKLELRDWKPDNLPGPELNSIVVDCGGMDEQEILYDIYSRTYDIKKDDRTLRMDPSKFEEIRGNYPVRREPSFFSVRLNNNPYESLEIVLDRLGFSVLEIDCFC